ncbi:MAG: L,D-transpeptidase [Ilumatobacter sp.]|uniref:L,D-transpeptidase n=1 Tax=Ilumatobacter sp. TaxID=1967498 RepID=UPI003918F1D5
MQSRIRPTRRHAALALAASVTFAACTSTVATETLPDQAAPADPATSIVEQPPTTIAPTPSTTTVPTPPSTAAEVATTAPTTSTSSTTTTSTVAPLPLDVFDPECVVRADSDSSLEAIAAANALADPVSLWLENGQIDSVASGDLVDICPGNNVNDLNGEPVPAFKNDVVQGALAANVERQQTKLNELFAGFGIDDLAVDGVSGPRTGQRLCAARLSLGLDTTIEDMTPGSNEQAALFAATTLPTPTSTATESERWVLIDRTCQIMFIGAGADTTFVFPTSTGSEGFETREQDRSEAFRFNPALDNGGWHDSSEFPVGVDNPLNGNLYKPLYFDLGQAIHGANNVPPTPQSKGCARLRVADQNTFVAWLGLDSATGETWRKAEMNVTVNVQGDFVARQNS